MSKRAIIVLCIIASLVFSGIFVYYVAKTYKINKANKNNSGEFVSNTLNKNNLDNTIKSTSKQTITVSPSAKLEMVQYFEECGHTVKDEYKVPSSVVNMTEEKVKEYYKGWKLTSFSKDKIKLYKVNTGKCSEHYIIKDISGYVNIFIQNEKGEEQLFRATDIMTKYLSEEDKSSLKKGIKVIGRDDLETILEDFE